MELISRNLDSVKTSIAVAAEDLLERLLDQASHPDASIADLERQVGTGLVAMGQQMVAFAFASACKAAMLRDLQARGLTERQVRVRADKDGYVTVNTTFGPVTFPTFAYRDESSPAGAVIRHPEATVLPYHARCHSSPLCLEWEARVGTGHAFRRAEELLRFFTRGASCLGDNTIAAHIVPLASMIGAHWTYRTPDEIRNILRHKATRDTKTGAPILYASADAHALRRYDGDTWARVWKMTNGLRLWCEDARTGKIVHLGGEYSWGDCRDVAARFRELVQVGILPNNSPEWQALDVRVVFVSDGAEWLIEHVLPALPAATVILDPYHLLDWIAAFAALVFGAGKAQARSLNGQARRLFLGEPEESATSRPQPRRGHKKRRRTQRRHAHSHHRHPAGRRPYGSGNDAHLKAFLDALAALELQKPEHLEACEALAERLAKNAARMDYPGYLARGFQIGSGAMESLHRQGSQQRLKLPGATWRQESSQAILNFRMMELAGRSNEFWSQPNLTVQIASAFNQQRRELCISSL